MLGQVDSIVTRLGLDNCDNIELLKEPCKKLKVPRPAYLVLGVLVVVVVSIVVGLAGSLLTNVLGMVYPAYQSTKAIETKGYDDDQQWLRYWIVFSVSLVFDSNLSFALDFIPFYHLIKLAYFILLFHPKVMLADKVFQMVIHPLYEKYHNKIDQQLNKLEGKAQGEYEKLKNKL